MKFLLLLGCLFLSPILLFGGSPGTEHDSATVRPIDRQGLLDLIRSDSGDVVIVNAWASWCKPCLEEMPGLVRIAAKYRTRDLRLILVAIDDPESLDTKIRPMLARAGVRFPSYILQGTPDDEFINAMNSSWSGALPATFIYDRGGVQVSMLVGGKTAHRFEEVLAPMFDKQSPPSDAGSPDDTAAAGRR